MESKEVNRRDFLKGGSLTSLMMMMGGVAIRGQDVSDDDTPTNYSGERDPISCGVIGCGYWGRDLISTLATLPNAPILGLCDTYPAYLRRALRMVDGAEGYDDYHKLLANKDIQAVFICTPSHKHRQIVEDALAAGKHVYCEAPLAVTLEDARAIAKAAKAHPGLHFQAGLQNRADPELHHLVEFVRTGAMGKNVRIQGQWHKKQSWRRTSPNEQFQRELNWRLDQKTSVGLIGEIGMHQVDVASWFLRARPQAVTGFGSIVLWDDGRTVPDTVDAVFEYPDGVRMNYNASLANSFDAAYDVYYGTFSAIMVRDRKAWMFKEVDSPLLGWEVYARKESFYKETGIVLGANATKLKAQGEDPTMSASAADERNNLSFALEAFLTNSGVIGAGVEDFKTFFDASDTEALRQYLSSLQGSLLPAAGYQMGYEAAVTAIKAHEAIQKSTRIELDPGLYEIG